MQIRLFLPLILVLSLGLLACQQADNAAAKPGIAVVDMARVMRDSEPGKAGVKFLEGLQSDMQEKLTGIQNRLEAKPDDAEAQKELQATYMEAQQRMQAEQQNVINLLYDTMQRVINAYRAEKGFSAILNAEAVVSFDSGADVTGDIIAAVNKQKMDFKPVTASGAASDAAAPVPQNADKADSEKDAPADKKPESPKNGKK